MVIVKAIRTRRTSILGEPHAVIDLDTAATVAEINLNFVAVIFAALFVFVLFVAMHDRGRFANVRIEV